MHKYYSNTINQKWTMLVENFSKYRQITATALFAIDLSVYPDGATGIDTPVPAVTRHSRSN
jgi:hypothetical protein